MAPPRVSPSGSGITGGYVLPPPTPKKQAVKLQPSQNQTLALLLKDPRFKKYASSIGVIQQSSGRWSLDPTDLLLILAATGIPADAKSIDAIGPKLQHYYGDGSPAAWSAARGIPLSFDPYAVRDSITGKAKFTQSYLPRPPQTPANTAGKSVDTSVARTKITSTDQWVVFDPKTKQVGYKKITQFDAGGNPAAPPKGVLMSGGGAVTKFYFDRQRADMNDYYTAYSGRPVSTEQLAENLYKGLSAYAIEQHLSTQPGFRRSRVWAAKAPGVIGYAKSVYGEGWKIDKELVQQAVVNNWDQGTLDRKLKERPEYLKGPAYKQSTASLNNVHMSIMGTPNQQDEINIHEAALEGWSADQYAQWIRSTKGYNYGPEAKAYAINIAERLGLITGKQGIVASSTSGGAPQPPQENVLPNSPRVAGKPGAVAPSIYNPNDVPQPYVSSTDTFKPTPAKRPAPAPKRRIGP